MPEFNHTYIGHNFTSGQTIRITGDKHPDIGPLVRIEQQSGSMTFLFSMKPEQARHVAGLLSLAANDAERGDS